MEPIPHSGARLPEIDARIFEYLGPLALADFKPHAYCSSGGDIIVLTKDCSYRACIAPRVHGMVELFWENHRPWYAPWASKIVGFSFYAPAITTNGEVPIVDLLRTFEEKYGRLKGYRRRLYRLAKGLTVSVS